MHLLIILRKRNGNLSFAVNVSTRVLYLQPGSDFSFIELFELLLIVELVHQGVHEIHVRLHHVGVCRGRQFLHKAKSFIRLFNKLSIKTGVSLGYPIL